MEVFDMDSKYLNKRTNDRIKRGVQGTYKK